MAQNTFPAFTEMVPTVQDLQLIVDSLRQEDRSRTTHDGIFLQVSLINLIPILLLEVAKIH